MHTCHPNSKQYTLLNQEEEINIIFFQIPLTSYLQSQTLNSPHLKQSAFSSIDWTFYGKTESRGRAELG